MRPLYAFRTDNVTKAQIRDAVNFMRLHVDPKFSSEDFGHHCIREGLKALADKHNAGKKFPRSRHPIRRGPASKE